MRHYSQISPLIKGRTAAKTCTLRIGQAAKINFGSKVFGEYINLRFVRISIPNKTAAVYRKVFF
jgi:hypothetical protein